MVKKTVPEKTASPSGIINNDVDWRPSASVAVLKARAKFLAQVRAFFADRGVIEIETPLLAKHAVTDLHLHSLSVHDQQERLGYLQTSPEYMMKRLLAAGSGDIYQIGKAFRGGELGCLHQPEFTMLEWYRLGFSMDDLIDEVIVLIKRFVGDFSVNKIAYSEVFLSRFAINPLDENIAAWQQVVEENCSVNVLPSTQDDCLDLLMTQVIAPTWPQQQITCIYNFPASQAALARLDPANPKVAKRFEVYCGAIELANGYHELTDAEEQQARMQKDNLKRRSQGLQEINIDAYLLAALKHGLPDCAGVALGLDRLFMLMMDENSISQILAFPRQAKSE